MAAFVYLSQVLDGEEQVVKVPESSLSTWLPRGWAPCDPPARKQRPAIEKPAGAPAAAKPTPTPKKSERSTSGRELKSEDNV
jgi:hypothetical protein